MHHGTENYCEEGNNFFFQICMIGFLDGLGIFWKKEKFFSQFFFYLKKLFFANF